MERSIAHEVQVERYKAGLVRRVVEVLNESKADLEAELTKRLSRIEAAGGYDAGPRCRSATYSGKDLLPPAEEGGAQHPSPSISTSTRTALCGRRCGLMERPSPKSWRVAWAPSSST